MTEDRFVSPHADGDEQVIEAALRPKRLEDFIGQARVREQLSLVLQSAAAARPAAGPRPAVRPARASARPPSP